jgi:hypothetical protein
VGVASVVAGSAGLTLIISLCTWMLHGDEPADASARAPGSGLSVFGTIHPPLINYGNGAMPADVPSAPPVRLASVNKLESSFASRFAPVAPDSRAETTGTASLPSFNDRFAAFKSPAPPAPATRSLRPSISFSDRFAGAIASGAAPTQLAMVAPNIAPVTAPAPAPVAAAAPAPAAPHAAARALAARVTPNTPKKQPAPGTYQVASIGDTPIRTAYASADAGNRDAAIDDSLLKKMTPRDPAPKDTAKDPDMSRTAIYDITAHVVYLPNGTRLEAHSGLAEHMDDLGAVALRSLGPTPPGLYNLTMREARFHVIEAIRLNPVDDGKMYGRAGILAHPYMLGPNGQSNGCVSLKDYDAFLAAFKRGEFNRIAVVERLDGDAPGGATATGWIADKIKGLFGRS